MCFFFSSPFLKLIEWVGSNFSVMRETRFQSRIVSAAGQTDHQRDGTVREAKRGPFWCARFRSRVVSVAGQTWPIGITGGSCKKFCCRDKTFAVTRRQLLANLITSVTEQCKRLNAARSVNLAFSSRRRRVGEREMLVLTLTSSRGDAEIKDPAVENAPFPPDVGELGRGRC